MPSSRYTYRVPSEVSRSSSHSSHRPGSSRFHDPNDVVVPDDSISAVSERRGSSRDDDLLYRRKITYTSRGPGSSRHSMADLGRNLPRIIEADGGEYFTREEEEYISAQWEIQQPVSSSGVRYSDRPTARPRDDRSHVSSSSRHSTSRPKYIEDTPRSEVSKHSSRHSATPSRRSRYQDDSGSDTEVERRSRVSSASRRSSRHGSTHDREESINDKLNRLNLGSAPVKPRTAIVDDLESTADLVIPSSYVPPAARGLASSAVGSSTSRRSHRSSRH